MVKKQVETSSFFRHNFEWMQVNKVWVEWISAVDIWRWCEFDTKYRADSIQAKVFDPVTKVMNIK